MDPDPKNLFASGFGSASHCKSDSCVHNLYQILKTQHVYENLICVGFMGGWMSQCDFRGGLAACQVPTAVTIPANQLVDRFLPELKQTCTIKKWNSLGRRSRAWASTRPEIWRRAKWSLSTLARSSGTTYHLYIILFITLDPHLITDLDLRSLVGTFINADLVPNDLVVYYFSPSRSALTDYRERRYEEQNRGIYMFRLGRFISRPIGTYGTCCGQF